MKHFSLLITSKREVLILFVSTHASKLLLWKYVTTVICEPVHDKTDMACAPSSVWLDSAVRSYEEALCPCLQINRIAKTLIRLGGWPRCGFVRFFDDFWTCISPILVWKTGRRLPQSPYGVCTDPHCIQRGTFRNLWGTRTGSCYTGPKIARTHREQGKRMSQMHRRRVISNGLLRTTASYSSPSLTSRGTPVGLMHAT